MTKARSIRRNGADRSIGDASAGTDLDHLVRSAFLYRPITSDQREVLHRSLDIGLRFLDGSLRDGRPIAHLEPDEIESFASSELPLTGTPLDALMVVVEELAKHSVAQCDPTYLAFPDTGNSLAGLVGDVVAACLNQNLIAVDRSAPVASHVEAQLILWLRDLVGYGSCQLADLPNLAALGGMWTSGGNMSNHVAMVAALQHRLPEVGRQGLVGLRKRPVVVLARGVEHFSYASAAQVLGLGRDALVWADSRPDFTSDVEALDATLTTLPDDVEPVMVVAVAGNCRTTGIDDLEAVAAVCERQGVWLHVDACHGGSLLFSRSLRRLVDGIERADSVSLDPHKGLFTTYACSFVIFKDPLVLTQFARYPARVHEPDCLDLGLISPFYGSRRFESLKLWLLIKHLGREGLEEVIGARHDTFMRLVRLVDDVGYFTRLNDPTFYRVALVFLPDTVRWRLHEVTTETGDMRAARKLVDEYTSRFSESLYRDGRVILDYFALQDLGNRIGFGPEHKYQVIGLAVGHPVLPDGSYGLVRDVLTEIGADLAEEMSAAVENLAASAAGERAASPMSGPAGW